MKATAFITRVPNNQSRARYQFARFMTDYHETTVITSDNNFPIENPSRLHSIQGSQIKRGILFPIYAIVLGLFKTRKSDVIYSDQLMFSVLPALIVSFLTRTPWVLTAADIPEGKYAVYKAQGGSKISLLYHKLNFAVQRFGLYCCDYIVMSDKSSVVDDSRDDVILAKGGCDCSKLPNNPQSENRTTNQIRAVYAGNLFYDRGIEIMLDSIEKCNNNVNLRLMGPLPDDTSGIWDIPSNENIQDRIDDIENCDYLGVVEHETALSEMQQADVGICLLPFNRGLNHFQYSYPIKVFEYLATGTAVVATDTIALRELLDDIELIETESSNQLAYRLQYWADNNEDLIEQKQANKRKGECYCWSVVIEELDNRLNESFEFKGL